MAETVADFAAELERSGATAQALLDQLAAKIADRLTGGVVSSALPAWVGDWIRRVATHGAYVWRYTVPMDRGSCMGIDIKLTPDGLLHLEFQDSNCSPFWRGTFRPEVTPDAHS